MVKKPDLAGHNCVTILRVKFKKEQDVNEHLRKENEALSHALLEKNEVIEKLREEMNKLKKEV